MKIKFLLCAVLTFFSVKIIAQNPDEEAVKKLVRLETETFIKRDTNTWKSIYVQDEKIRIMVVIKGGVFKIEGWNNFAAWVRQSFLESPSPSKYTEVRDDNYVIRAGDNVATVEYDEKISPPGADSLKAFYSHELRTLMKVDNQWKIASSTSIDSLSFKARDSTTVEDDLNAAGYKLLNAKKVTDAIEVFKANVKLFPNSWNVYDSLGEAYADDGNTDDAIKNYEMSVKINPKNENGTRALEKLRKKK